MRRPSILKAVFIVLLFTITRLTFSQGNTDPSKPFPSTEKKAKPYKILTSGKQITIQSKQDIKSVMVWTSNGHRFIEQKEINSSTFKFTVTVDIKIFFLLFETTEGKRYTEKLAVQ